LSLVGVAATIAFAVLMPKLSDLQSLVEAASSIAAGNVFWGAVDIITTIAGYVPWGKVWKSIGELVKAVGPLRKFYLAIDKYGSAGMAKLRKYLNEKRGRATYEDGKVKISNPDGTKIDAEDVVRAGITNLEELFKNPSKIWGKKHTDLDDLLTSKGWKKSEYQGNSDAVLYTFDGGKAGISSIVFNYQGSRHENAVYYKIEGAEIEKFTGKNTKVIDVKNYGDEWRFENSKIIDEPTGKVLKN